jgi:hypothetical protein
MDRFHKQLLHAVNALSDFDLARLCASMRDGDHLDVGRIFAGAFNSITQADANIAEAGQRALRAA